MRIVTHHVTLRKYIALCGRRRCDSGGGCHYASRAPLSVSVVYGSERQGLNNPSKVQYAYRDKHSGPRAMDRRRRGRNDYKSSLPGSGNAVICYYVADRGRRVVGQAQANTSLPRRCRMQIVKCEGKPVATLGTAEDAMVLQADSYIALLGEPLRRRVCNLDVVWTEFLLPDMHELVRRCVCVS